MLLSLWSLFTLLRITINGLSQAKSIQGDSWCGDLMCATAFINSSVVTYQLISLNQLGWIAIGFGTQMSDAKMVILWPNMDGTVTLSQRTATGLVEPDPDPNPPRVATLFQPLTILSAIKPALSFTIPKDDTIIQDVIWALGFDNPQSDSSNVTLLMHVESGNFTLNLTNMIDTDNIPTPGSPQSINNTQNSSNVNSPTESSTDGSAGSQESNGGHTNPLQSFEKLIIAHASISAVGFLVILPFGALVARWGRTFTQKWFYYHWISLVFLSIPMVVIGWSLGPLSVADQGNKHADDVHKICGILVLPLYFLQLGLGSFIHFRKPPFPRRHPPQNFLHGTLGILIISLAFYQARTGITMEWTKATSRPINIAIFSNLWVAWVTFISVTYALGFGLIPRQVATERALPPPYTLRDESPDRQSSRQGLRSLLRGHTSDDGTHDLFSEENVSHRSGVTESATATGEIEMREVALEHWTPFSVASSR